MLRHVGQFNVSHNPAFDVSCKINKKYLSREVSVLVHFSGWSLYDSCIDEYLLNLIWQLLIFQSRYSVNVTTDSLALLSRDLSVFLRPCMPQSVKI